MYKVGDIIPYYVDWDNKNPQILEGYGKIVDIIKEDFDYDLIYDEMSEGNQEIYTRLRAKLLVSSHKIRELKFGKMVDTVEPYIIVRNISYLKQIGIHNHNTINTLIKYENRNKFGFKEGNVAKMKNNKNKAALVVINKEDMYRIYNEKSTEYVYKPILIDKRNYKLVDNDEFNIDSRLNIRFKTINCESDCPLHWKPTYIHECQNIFNIITNKELIIDNILLKKALIAKKNDYKNNVFGKYSKKENIFYLDNEEYLEEAKKRYPDAFIQQTNQKNHYEN
ncbi:MAG TPA: hypothetical protein PKD00_01480 [Burkholderiales bacterium]|nr:hypothetical protein [Burkholderiales bacterium]